MNILRVWGARLDSIRSNLGSHLASAGTPTRYQRFTRHEWESDYKPWVERVDGMNILRVWGDGEGDGEGDGLTFYRIVESDGQLSLEIVKLGQGGEWTNVPADRQASVLLAELATKSRKETDIHLAPLECEPDYRVHLIKHGRRLTRSYNSAD